MRAIAEWLFMFNKSVYGHKFLYILGPYQGLGDLGRRVIYFQGSGKQASKNWVLGHRDLKKRFKGSGEKAHYFFQGARR